VGPIEILLIAVGLAMDAFAVSLGIGAAGRANSARSIFRLSFHFGFFQFAMPVLGWLGGTSIEHLIRNILRQGHRSPRRADPDRHRPACAD
jgi:putative Mn2+ efflux pump MntP